VERRKKRKKEKEIGGANGSVYSKGMRLDVRNIERDRHGEGGDRGALENLFRKGAFVNTFLGNQEIHRLNP